MSINKKIRLIKKALNSNKRQYIAYSQLPLDEKAILLEGGQGGNINGNMFAMLKEVCTNPRWSSYKPIFVVTEASIDAARKRMQFYGFDHVELCVRNSDAYCRQLATAKYLATDNSFPPFFNKRAGQVYLNTWHGTPLKTLGLANKDSLASVGNVQKNFVMSDYVLYPNRHTEQVFKKDYQLEKLPGNKSFICNYPRNSIFYNKQAGVALKKQLGYEDKRVIAYMPTWRGNNTQASKLKQLTITKSLLEDFDAVLDDSTVLLVNLHFVLASGIDCSQFKHIAYFDSNYETYEILNACDGLITDYSSVFFDFAVTRKPVVLFAYDQEEYLANRGTYMPFDSLPFKTVHTAREVIDAFDASYDIPESFIQEFCSYGSEHSCEDVVELLLTGVSESITLEDATDNQKQLCLLYAGGLSAARVAAIAAYVDEHPQYRFVLTYRKKLGYKYKQMLEEIPADIALFGLLTAFQFSLTEFMKFCFYCISGMNAGLQGLFERERNRLFPALAPQLLVSFDQSNKLIQGILSTFNCDKVACSFLNMGRYPKMVRRLHAQTGFTADDLLTRQVDSYLQSADKKAIQKSLGSLVKMKNNLPLYFNMRNHIACFSAFSFVAPFACKMDDVEIVVGEKTYHPRYFTSGKSSCKHRGFYFFKLPVTDLIDLPSNNPVYARCMRNGAFVDGKVKFFSPLGRYLAGLRSPIYKHEDTSSVLIFRQSRNNDLTVYVRSKNVTDAFVERFKQVVACFCAMFWQTNKAKKLILLYEKNASKYEESASVVYEYLIDHGFDNAYFIVDKNYEYIDRIKPQYRSNIIYKYSFKHYLYFFKSRTFIGTEALVHSIDLKTFNVLPLYKISRKNLNYVFLQHGVMYMVSLDSESRKMFKRKNLDGAYRVVVSSQAEADHFIELGRHKPEDLYICGLPKFDKSYLNDDADKIVIIPTWRPWEINLIRDNFKESPYFKMIMRIYNEVPDDLKKHVVILPHPLVFNEITESCPEIVDALSVNNQYDEILRTARVLITDYSSISYDAFYRGTRVLFYWEEKDECIEHYGPTTKLMLNEDNVFGDVFYDTTNLKDSIQKNYYSEQDPLYVERYSKLVEFHDGHNTERLVQFLKDDGII